MVCIAYITGSAKTVLIQTKLLSTDNYFVFSRLFVCNYEVVHGRMQDSKQMSESLEIKYKVRNVLWFKMCMHRPKHLITSQSIRFFGLSRALHVLFFYSKYAYVIV